MKALKDRITRLITAPLRIVDDWTDFEVGLTADDLIADLDPGWLEWREQITRAAEPLQEVA